MFSPIARNLVLLFLVCFLWCGKWVTLGRDVIPLFALMGFFMGWALRRDFQREEQIYHEWQTTPY